MRTIPGLSRFTAVALSSLLLSSQPAILGRSSASSVPGPINLQARSNKTAATSKTETRIQKDYGKLPLAFEVNAGQTDSRVKFVARGAGYSIFLTGDEAVLRLRKRQLELAKTQPISSNVLRMKLIGASAAPVVSGEDVQEGKSNYFVGKDSTRWQANVPNYSRVRYANVYRGVDQIFYGNQGQLEYDFVIAPEADYKQIRMKFAGAKRVRIDQTTGEVVLQFRDGSEARQPEPYSYQMSSGLRTKVAVKYVITRTGEVSFVAAEYDRTQPLIIDPILVYSTYLGGTGSDTGNDIAVDSFGNAYVTGETDSLNFPTTNPLQPGRDGGFDVFVTKINAIGSARFYSTYLGGGGSDEGNGIAVDASGNAYVAGSTTSTDFPTFFANQSANGGGRDAFVSKLNSFGSGLFYSTYLGGSATDTGSAIALDSAGNAYVVGSTNSTNYPTFIALRPFNAGGFDAFLTKLTAAGSGRVFSTYLGGSGDDSGFGVAVDASNNVYVTGSVASTNFPTINAVQVLSQGGIDAFITEINSAGSAFVYSTYLGGLAEDVGRGIDVDSSGNAYVTGHTFSSDFPAINAFQFLLRGGSDAFVTKMNAGGAGLAYSTYLGGSDGNDAGQAIAVDQSGSAHVTGSTLSNNFPTFIPIQATRGDFFNSDGFVTKLTPGGAALIYSTYLGGNHSDEGHGIAVDTSNNAYVTGVTFATNFPVANAIQPLNGSSGGIISNDAFVTKIFDNITPLPSVQLSAPTYSMGEAATTVQIVVNRITSSGAGTVDYATSDNAGSNECNVFNGLASSRCDFTTSRGTLRFAAGESSKTVFVSIVNDSYAEGNETFSFTLSNPSGMSLGTNTTATITIQDNDAVTGPNPIDGVDFFIRQHYLDFLGREPDPQGLAGWRNVLNNCGITVAPPCDRIEVSAGFFRSEEFQSRGYFIYRFYSTLGRIPVYPEFVADFGKVSGFLTTEQLETNKAAFVNEFMARPEFQTRYSSTFNNPTAYVDSLLATVGLPAHPSRNTWINQLNASNTTQTRGQVLRQLVESTQVYNKYYNEAFVIMQYFGYLRRTADALYVDWLQIMNATGGDYRVMVNGFINSAEYRRRFGP
ncbi:MAG TPA: SBBP repeat-containing protein [Pyrinomonadaceae bacterium]|nr:SBBP repeat-containing protein [Pyrinomonadaceae bacterium]